MLRSRRLVKGSSWFLVPIFGLFVGCLGGGSKGSSSSGDGETCFDCNVSQASFLHLDSENIAALLSVDPDTLQSSSALTLKGVEEGGETELSPVQGMDADTGDIRDSLRCFFEETGDSFDADSDAGLSADCWDTIPRIVTIAECDGYVYLVFERSFIVRTTAPGDDGILGTRDDISIEDYSDPWSPSSPFTAQLLRSSVPITDYQAGDRLERANLEGVLYSLEINTWDRRRNIQFDGQCNLYVTAHVSGTSNDILIEIAPGAAEDEYTEVINANICYQRYLVTSAGEVHYTGSTSVGQDCSGDSFYRVVSSSGALTEITRDWWNYQFEPQDDGTVIFYGPDPTEDGVPSWDSACLFRFDGTRSGDARYSKLVNCINDWWRYVSEGPDAEFVTTSNDTNRERCSEQFYTLRGSNAPDRILSIDRGGDGTKEVCVVADTEYKRTGTWMCNICVNAGSNCENSSGMITGDTTQAACQATTGNTWVSTNECYQDVTTSACTITQPAGWDLNNDWCRDPGTNWSQSYAALSCVLANKSVEVISSTSETVTNAWVIGNRIIYSSVADGEYHLKAVDFDGNGTASVSNLVSGTEMYEVADDPTEGVDRLLVNGLRFSDNSYVFGHYDFDTDELSVESSLTGLVEAILIVGN